MAHSPFNAGSRGEEEKINQECIWQGEDKTYIPVILRGEIIISNFCGYFVVLLENCCNLF